MGEKTVCICKGDLQTGEHIKHKLIEYNLQKSGFPEGPVAESVCLVIKTPEDHIVGGINATVKPIWGWCHIDTFWIDEQYRHCGYGSRLIKQIEEIAKQKHCKTIQLETSSFQAPEFYKKQGYELIGSMEILPVGSFRYFFTKSILV